MTNNFLNYVLNILKKFSKFKDEPRTGQPEVETIEERNEIKDFLDTILTFKPMTMLYELLRRKGFYIFLFSRILFAFFENISKKIFFFNHFYLFLVSKFQGCVWFRGFVLGYNWGLYWFESSGYQLVFDLFLLFQFSQNK